MTTQPTISSSEASKWHSILLMTHLLQSIVQLQQISFLKTPAAVNASLFDGIPELSQ